MNTIQLDIDDDLIQEFGEQAIQAFIEKQLEMFKLQRLGKKISNVCHESGVDPLEEFEQAREEAWDKFKESTL